MRQREYAVGPRDLADLAATVQLRLHRARDEQLERIAEPKRVDGLAQILARGARVGAGVEDVAAFLLDEQSAERLSSQS